jgi:hypothetical protein
VISYELARKMQDELDAKAAEYATKRTMYLEDIAHKRENYKMDLWTFGS